MDPRSIPLRRNRVPYFLIRSPLDLTSIILVGEGQPAAGLDQLLIKWVEREGAGEGAALAAGLLCGQLLLVQVHANCAVPLQAEKAVEVRRFQGYGQDAAVEHVLPEDPGKTLRDHAR